MRGRWDLGIASPDHVRMASETDEHDALVASDSIRLVSATGARYRKLGRFLILSDSACLILALVIAYIGRWGTTPIVSAYLLVLAASPIAWYLIHRGYSLYETQRLSPLEEFRRVISASSVGVVVIVLLDFWSHSSLSRIWVGLTWALVLIFELASRRLWRLHVTRLRRKGELNLRTLVIGTGREARALADELREPDFGLSPVGFVGERASSSDLGLPLLGEVAELDRLVDVHAVDCLFIASPELRDGDIQEITRLARKKDLELKVSSSLPEISPARVSIQPIGSTMAVSLRPVKLSGPQRTLKRAFDVVTSTVILVLLSPVMIFLALLIRLTSKGPALFRQVRVTRGGRAFVMYKYRTMLHEPSPGAGADALDTSVPFFKLPSDHVGFTRVGRVLRKWSLDELPQMINVLKGDMSLVGPRPLPVEQVSANLDLLEARHEVLAGVTGWWQTQGRSDVDPDEALRLDLFYIENWSLSLDLFILLKTMGAVIARRGAF
jgi:exopolysaccharide biosynthesis polyprenyl glycosylphosphotransferase